MFKAMLDVLMRRFLTNPDTPHRRIPPLSLVLILLLATSVIVMSDGYVVGSDTGPRNALTGLALAGTTYTPTVGVHYAPGIPAPPACTRYVSTTGTDTNPGTQALPKRTLEGADQAAAPGDTWCFDPGRYEQNPSTKNVWNSSGTAPNPIFIRSTDITHPAVLGGQIVTRGTITYQEIKFDGSNSIVASSGQYAGTHSQTQVVDGDNIRFWSVDMTNRGVSICMSITGYTPSGGDPNKADNTQVRGSKIHHCGLFDPASSRWNHDHAIYSDQANNTNIAYNWLYWNQSRGVQNYTNSDDARIHHNVVVDNKEGINFSGSGTDVSERDLASNNIVAIVNRTNDLEPYSSRYNLTVSWLQVTVPIPSGANINHADYNCTYRPRSDFNGPSGIESPVKGLAYSGNYTQKPIFVRPATRNPDSVANYRLASGSGCANTIPGNHP